MENCFNYTNSPQIAAQQTTLFQIKRTTFLNELHFKQLITLQKLRSCLIIIKI